MSAIPAASLPDVRLKAMRIKEIAEQAASLEEPAGTHDRDLYEMANLFPQTTGLPMTVWVSPRGNARHDVRVKVNMRRGDQMNIANTAVVGARPPPRLISGRLPPADAQAVFEWVELNTDALVAYWDGRIDAAEMIQALRSLPPDRPPATPPAP